MRHVVHNRKVSYKIAGNDSEIQKTIANIHGIIDAILKQAKEDGLDVHKSHFTIKEKNKNNSELKKRYEISLASFAQMAKEVAVLRGSDSMIKKMLDTENVLIVHTLKRHYDCGKVDGVLGVKLNTSSYRWRHLKDEFTRYANKFPGTCKNAKETVYPDYKKYALAMRDAVCISTKSLMEQKFNSKIYPPHSSSTIAKNMVKNALDLIINPSPFHRRIG